MLGEWRYIIPLFNYPSCNGYSFVYVLLWIQLGNLGFKKLFMTKSKLQLCPFLLSFTNKQKYGYLIKRCIFLKQTFVKIMSGYIYIGFLS